MLMLSLYCKARALWATRDRGASAAEYAMLIAAIAAIVAAVIFAIGGSVSGMFNDACTKVTDASGKGTCP
jgi:pilus assembly protein Flp/PilA